MFELLNLTVVRGDRWVLSFTLPAGLGATPAVEFAVAEAEGEDPFIQADTANGGVTVANGVATYVLDNDDSLLIDPGLYVYSVRTLDADAEMTCYRGRLRVRERIGTGTGPPPPVPDYTPGLVFSDARNSMYVPALPA